MVDEKGCPGTQGCGRKGSAGGVLRAGLMTRGDQGRAPMVSGAGMGEKGDLGQTCVPSGPQAIFVKGLGAGPYHAKASLPALWPRIPCPVSGRSGLAPCPPAAATGLHRGSPNSLSEASGSSSALSGQTGSKKRERRVWKCFLPEPTLPSSVLSGHVGAEKGLMQTQPA